MYLININLMISGIICDRNVQTFVLSMVITISLTFAFY